MKRWICICLALLMLVQVGCSPVVPDETTTLMIYMVGSDLEAKAGAAGKDLAEIAGSGIDLTKNNVLVYAGGSEIWHNGEATPEQHKVLQLTDAGYVSLASTGNRSMGESGCLTNFLNYCWETFPADRFALMLWDHGDGPVIGYGRDMLFDNDSLTLQEMGEAMAASPFGPENKLAWVGFDACMMASAELSCTWAPYAEYLVASQEVEPSFGWDYSFLANLGKVDTPVLLTQATETYLATCQAYYESRGYENRDTTLSCVDLSKTEKLEEALNNLFARAAAGVATQYNELAVRRVRTRALGRTSTGSEYDLIDLQDLAVQLQDLYPEESGALMEVLEDMVVSNATNTVGCCGMSLYYPFYNKAYYSKSWSQAYQELGLFPAYQEYLQGYETVWLKNDLMDKVASSRMPVDTAGTYTLQLTPQQQETFASARYYILTRDGEELYTRIFTSENITNENGLLTANFDGRVIYARDAHGNYCVPVVKEHETVGDMTRYSAYVKLSNGSDFAWGQSEIDWIMEDYRICLTLDHPTGNVSMDSIVRSDFETQQDVLSGGKLEEGNLADWPVCYFKQAEHRYLTRDENGTIVGLESWPDNGWFSSRIINTNAGFEFVYAPLAEGEYCLVFEIEDTQGNRYCSELLPIEADGDIPVPPEKDPVELDLTNSDRVRLYQDQGVTVDFRIVKAITADGGVGRKYALEIKNDNEFDIIVSLQDLRWGDDIYCGGGNMVDVEAKSTVFEACDLWLGAAEYWDSDPNRLDIAFNLMIYEPITYKSLVYKQPCYIQFSPETILYADEESYRLDTIDSPILGAMAEQQVLLDTPEVRVTLLGIGNNSMGNDSGYEPRLGCVVCIENCTDRPIRMELSGLAVNSIYLGRGVSQFLEEIPANCKAYRVYNIYNNELEAVGITSISSVTVLLQQQAYSLLSGWGRHEQYWCPVELSQAGEIVRCPEGDQILMDQNGVRVTLLEQGYTGEGLYTITMMATNTTDQDMSFEAADPDTLERFSSEGWAFFSASQVGPGQSCILKVNVYLNQHESAERSVSFRMRVMDFMEGAILFYSDDIITLEIES